MTRDLYNVRSTSEDNRLLSRLAAGVWYNEGNAQEVAVAVLRDPELFDELFECVLSEDPGTAKRAAMALETVSQKRADLFALYTDILLTELESGGKWFVRFWLCPIVPRVKLKRYETERAIALLRELADHSQNALAVNALDALTQFALRDEDLREETIWLVENKMRYGSKAMQARCRHLLPKLYGKDK